jgi:thiamine biosynthesis lipoprotein
MKVATAALALIVAANAFAVTRARYLMGTVCEVSAGDARQIEKAFDEAARVEALISTWRDDSELSRVNAKRIAPSHELAELLASVDVWRIATGGAFEPRIRPLIDAWKTRGEGAVPDGAVIAHAVAAIRAGIAPVEEGGFGKGYALDRMLPLIGGDAVLNFGGQLLVRGSHEVTIAHPANRNVPFATLVLTDASLSTSSGSEKTFIVNGRTFTHILDPRTGEALPPRGSVSVVASRALDADILSTALYVMGADDGVRWCNEHGVAALFLSRDGVARASRTFPKFKLKD